MSIVRPRLWHSAAPMTTSRTRLACAVVSSLALGGFSTFYGSRCKGGQRAVESGRLSPSAGVEVLIFDPRAPSPLTSADGTSGLNALRVYWTRPSDDCRYVGFVARHDNDLTFHTIDLTRRPYVARVFSTPLAANVHRRARGRFIFSPDSAIVAFADGTDQTLSIADLASGTARLLPGNFSQADVFAVARAR